MMTKSVRIVNNLTGIKRQNGLLALVVNRENERSSCPYHFLLFVFLKGYIMEEILSALVGAVNLVLWTTC